MIEIYTDGSSKIAKDGTHIGGWAVYMPGTEDPIFAAVRSEMLLINEWS